MSEEKPKEIPTQDVQVQGLVVGKLSVCNVPKSPLEEIKDFVISKQNSDIHNINKERSKHGLTPIAGGDVDLVTAQSDKNVDEKGQPFHC